MDRDFNTFKAGEFLEVFNPKFNIWVLCEIVTNYGILRSEQEYKWGYEVRVLQEKLDAKLQEHYGIYEATWVITEDMSRKWWREAPPAAKVLYGHQEGR